MLTTILKAFDTLVINAKTSSSITLSLTSIGLLVIPISIGIACGIISNNLVIYEIAMQKFNIHKKNKIMKISKSLNLSKNYIERVYKIFQLIELNMNRDSLCNIFNRCLDEKN